MLRFGSRAYRTMCDELEMENGSAHAEMHVTAAEHVDRVPVFDPILSGNEPFGVPVGMGV